MAYYPLCVVSDVEAIVRQQCPDTTYASGTKPTLASVNNFILETTSHLVSVCDAAGYDTDNFHETSSVASTAVLSDATEATLTDATGFLAGDASKVEGLVSGVSTVVFINLKTVVSNLVTFSTLGTSFNPAPTFYRVNVALRLLRDICAVGAAMRAVEAGYESISPSMSEFKESLQARFVGSEKTQWGLWAITNVEGFLKGATTTTGAVTRSTIHSYREQNTDYQDDQWFERDMDF